MLLFCLVIKGAVSVVAHFLAALGRLAPYLLRR